MKANHRIYSLPYNGTNPAWFLQEVEKRKAHLDHVYCELPLDESIMLSHVRFLFDGKDGAAINQPGTNQWKQVVCSGGGDQAIVVGDCMVPTGATAGEGRGSCPCNIPTSKIASRGEWGGEGRTRVARLASLS